MRHNSLALALVRAEICKSQAAGSTRAPGRRGFRLARRLAAIGLGRWLRRDRRA